MPEGWAAPRDLGGYRVLTSPFDPAAISPFGWAAMRCLCFLIPSLLGMALPFGLPGCGKQGPVTFQGYIEGEYVYASVPLAGYLEELAVARGDVVAKDQRLFVLEHETENDGVQEAKSRLSQAESQLENLRKGKRPSEIASLEAQLAEAKSRLALAESEFERRRKLGATDGGVISKEELERSARGLEAQRARVDQLTADLETARLGARPDEIAAAVDHVAAQRAVLGQAEWALRRKTAQAPAAGFVQDTLYRQGEWVAAGQPVVVLLPPANVKVRFFVPQPQLATIRAGLPFRIRIDGTPRDYEGHVTYISTRVEFTPPVIYSDERRAKLVYLIEGEFAPEVARELKPGQPVEVIPQFSPAVP